MPGIGIGLGLGGGAGGWSEATIARALTARGLSDAAARAAVGGAASLAAGLRAVGLLPTPAPTPTPSVTPLPSGIAAMWDAASLAGLADGAAVTSWTDGVGGAVATQTGDSTTSHTYVANSGGLPAVRLSGAAVLVTSGSDAAATAMAGAERSIMVVARAIQTAGSGQTNPCFVSTSADSNCLLQATPTQTGRYGAMFDCADAGMRTIGYAASSSLGYAIDGINGSAITAADQQPAGSAIGIGGWKTVSTKCCGRADVLAVIVFNRAVTSADFKQVHRRYCELLGQTRPGGASARTVSFIGDSLTAGYTGADQAGPGIFATSYPHGVIQALGLPWGTWDFMPRIGYTWPNVQQKVMPRLGAISAATGTRNIVCCFEFANSRSDGAAAVEGYARTVTDALHAQDGNRELIFGTSTDDGSATGQSTQSARAAYNAFWDNAANRSGIAAYVQTHLDPHVGVAGAAPTNGQAGTYYQADNLHLTPAGYALLDAGPYGFRAAVQARLAAA